MNAKEIGNADNNCPRSGSRSGLTVGHNLGIMIESNYQRQGDADLFNRGSGKMHEIVPYMGENPTRPVLALITRQKGMSDYDKLSWWFAKQILKQLT